MRTRSFFLLRYLGFWIAFFEISRVVFLLYQWRHTEQLDAALAGGALLHGLRMDVAVASLLTLIPLCIVARAGFLPDRVVRGAIFGYTLSTLAVSTIAIVADLELFNVWGYRLDASSLHYLESPREAFASASASPILLLIVLLLAILTAGSLVYRRLLSPIFRRIAPVSQRRSLLLVVAALPVLVIGGGLFGRIPLTASSVYFSRNHFANQAAVNPVWNVAASILGGMREQVVHQYAEHDIARAIVDSLLAQEQSPGSASHPKLIRNRPQKVVLLFWEALTAKIVEPLGGRRGITTGFASLSSQGILFADFYASGPRTTHGLVAALSGLPSHPTANVLQSARRAAALPSLSMTMAAAGYRTGFYYGGPLGFDDRNRYFLRGDYGDVVEKKDFHPRHWQSPWGVHDDLVLDRLFHAVDAATSPIFAVTLTLSSHEPFKLPPPAATTEGSAEQRFLRAQAYTDSAVFRFVERAKAAPWWDSTLLIIIADHGSPYPFAGSPLASAPEHYRIAMLWLGGALSVSDTIVRRIGSHSDLPNTLLGQLGIPALEYRWGKDLLAPDRRDFAFYSFPDGFGYIDASGSYVFDNVAESVIHRTGNPTATSLTAGRAFQQIVMQEYLDLSDLPRE